MVCHPDCAAAADTRSKANAPKILVKIRISLPRNVLSDCFSALWPSRDDCSLGFMMVLRFPLFGSHLIAVALPASVALRVVVLTQVAIGLARQMLSNGTLRLRGIISLVLIFTREFLHFLRPVRSD